METRLGSKLENDKKLYVFNCNLQRQSNSGVILLRESEIKTVKFLKWFAAWFKIGKASWLQFKISRRKRKRDDIFYNEESLTAISQFISVWIFPTETSSNTCEDWTDLMIFTIGQWINHLFLPLCLLFYNFSYSKQTKHAVSRGRMPRSTYKLEYDRSSNLWIGL